MTPQIAPEHEWLKQMLGEWTFSVSATNPDGKTIELTGTESVRSLGDVWIIADGRGEMPGGGVGYNQLTIGYDTATQQFVGTWIGSMMTNMWVYKGSLDPARKKLTLETEGPDWSHEGKTAIYHEIIEFISSDERTFTSKVQTADGTWSTMMASTYRRKK